MERSTYRRRSLLPGIHSLHLFLLELHAPHGLLYALLDRSHLQLASNLSR